MKIPEAVIEHLRTIDIRYGDITIMVNQEEKHCDVCVKERIRIKVEKNNEMDYILK